MSGPDKDAVVDWAAHTPSGAPAVQGSGKDGGAGEAATGQGGEAQGGEAQGPVVVLIGPPGAGKTTVGQQLAARLGVVLHDTDQAIEAAQQRSISDIFVQDGEAHFRELERAEVLRALDEEDGVLALGGGAVMQSEVEQALRGGGHRVVFLDVTIADASKRVGFDASRPLLLINPRASWTRLMNARRPTYEALASLRVDTGGRAPEEIVEEIVSSLALETGQQGEDADGADRS